MTTLLSSDGTKIAYSQTGTGPALILIDGAFCYRGAGPCTPLAAALASQFTTYTYDRRGRGESSDASPYAVERELDDLEALIAAAGGSAHVYGVSSGAVLGLLGARRGLGITGLGLFEPPLPVGPMPGPDFSRELDSLVRAGRRGDAVEHFQLTIGLPPEMVTGMRHAPNRAALEAIAHTLVYDTTVTTSLPLDALSTIDTPALVIASADSTDGLHTAAKKAAETLPNGRLIHLPGRFHDVPAEDLAPVLAEFFTRAAFTG